MATLWHLVSRMRPAGRERRRPSYTARMLQHPRDTLDSKSGRVTFSATEVLRVARSSIIVSQRAGKGCHTEV